MEGSAHRAQEPFEPIQVALGRSGESLLDKVVAGDVDGVDPVHHVGVRAEGVPASAQASNAIRSRNRPRAGFCVTAGRGAEGRAPRLGRAGHPPCLRLRPVGARPRVVCNSMRDDSDRVTWPTMNAGLTPPGE